MTKKIYFILGIFIFTIVCAYAQQPVCATPGADGVQEFPAPQNSFFPGMGNDITVNAGATTFSLDPIPAPFVVGGVLYDFGNKQISKGDLLLIIQIQGASINTTNTVSYGSGNAANNGSGYINMNNVGRYEYMVALNDVGSTGGVLRFRGSGTGGGLLYSYQNKPASITEGVKRFQVVRLMQYSDLTLTSDVKTTPWNGKAGGLIAIDVAGTLNFNGKTINASMTGFRGGYLPSRTIQNQQYTNYVSSIYGDNNAGSTKGEGIAGTPRYVWDGYAYLDQGSSWMGYPNGDLNRGAPGNAGGGGNVHNAGGGGGGNGGAGGQGGYGWPLNNLGPQTNDQNSQLSLQTGGRPGVAMPSNVSNGLLFMGGGGGAGDANNSSNGAKGGVGGGIVIITANKIAGNGFILSNGGKGDPGDVAGSGDGAGGGGAGGSVFINVKEPSSGNLYIQTKGGNGGHSTTSTIHGPGGGGGGGIIYYNANGAIVTTDVTPGAAGRINDGNPVNPSDYADFPVGANKLQNGTLPGNSGIAASFSQNDLPPYLASSAYCYPKLSVKKWRDTPLDSIPAGSMITYNIRIDNAGGGAKDVRLNDPLPGSFTFVSATIDFDTTTGNPQLLNNIGTATNPILGTFNLVSGEGATVQMQVQVPFMTPEGTYHNGIQIGYLDPTRVKGTPQRVIYPPTNSITGQQTTYATGNEVVEGSNYSQDQEGEEVVVKKPEIGIQKTINNPCVVSGGNVYSISLLNPNPVVLNSVVVTDIIDSELDIISVSGTGWTVTNSGNTYTLTLNSLAAANGSTLFTSAPVNITVRPKTTATKSNWTNTATVPTSKGVASSSVMLYQQPTTATATRTTFAGQTCEDGIYYIQGNQPTVGIGKWEFTSASGNAFFEDPNQRNTRILGMQPNQTVSVVWRITNSPCGSVSSPALTFTAPSRPTAVISGGGTICGGAALDSAPAITVTLTPAEGYKRIKYIDGGGFERFILSANGATTISIPRDYAGTYTLLEVKQSTTLTSATDTGWNTVCPGPVSGTAQINVIAAAPVGGVINYHGGPVCKGEVVPMSLVLTGHAGKVVGWRSSTDGTTWSGIISGTENVTSYSPTVNANIYYRAEIGSVEVNGTPCFPSAFSASVYLVVKDCTDLSITKTINNQTPDAGSTVTFTVTALNTKEQNTTGVVVQDKLPNGYTYQNHNAAAGIYDPLTGVWNIGSLNAGQSRILTITAFVNQSGQYTNKAVISCTEQETNYANNTAEVTPVPKCDVRNISPKATKP